MHTPLLFSLHPRWADLVLSGRKTIEVRRRFARHDAYPTLAFIYATGTVGAVVGSVRLQGAQTVSPADLQGRLAPQTCIPDADLRAYLGNRTHAEAISLSHPTRLATPFSLHDLRGMGLSPPQLFSWIPPHVLSTFLGEPSLPGPASRHSGDVWAVLPVALDEVDPSSPLCDTPRALYGDAFDTWFTKARAERRTAWGVLSQTATSTPTLRALAVLAPRPDSCIKLCMFNALDTGMGPFLLDRVLARAQNDGTRTIVADVLASEARTRAFFVRAGGAEAPHPSKPGIVRATFAFS